MVTRQGDLSLLDHPVAQRLLRSHVPAHLSYVWTDGTPRVVPIGFHWNGKEIVIGTYPYSPKMKVLRDGSKVSLAIDSDRMPYNVLMIRGSVKIEIREGIAPEYEAMIFRTQGDEAGAEWLASTRTVVPELGVISITPEWVGVIDFETRFPSGLERAIQNDGEQAGKKSPEA